MADSSSRSNKTTQTVLPRAPVTLQLFPSVGQELTISQSAPGVLKITKKTRKTETEDEIVTDRENERLRLTRDAVFPTYADDTEIIDLGRFRRMDMVLSGETISHQFLSQHDAFTFQHLVTDYIPFQSLRFEKVSAFALDQHTSLFQQAIKIDIIGEAQLWHYSPPESQKELKSLHHSPTGSSMGGGPGSIFSAPPMLTGATVEEDEKGRAIELKIARPPPLLVIFAKTPVDRKGKKSNQGAYHTMRVNVNNLKCEYSAKYRIGLVLKPATSKVEELSVHVLTGQSMAAWNICHLRPEQFKAYFREHKCKKLELQFNDRDTADLFKDKFARLRYKAREAQLPSPGISSGRPSLVMDSGDATSTLLTERRESGTGGEGVQPSDIPVDRVTTAEQQPTGMVPPTESSFGGFGRIQDWRQDLPVDPSEATNFHTIVLSRRNEEMRGAGRRAGDDDEGGSSRLYPPSDLEDQSSFLHAQDRSSRSASSRGDLYSRYGRR